MYFFICLTKAEECYFLQRCANNETVFLKFSQNSREILVVKSLSNRVAGQGPATLLKRDFNASVFLWICEHFKNIFSMGHLSWLHL